MDTSNPVFLRPFAPFADLGFFSVGSCYMFRCNRNVSLSLKFSFNFDQTFCICVMRRLFRKFVKL
jgi:hypothetical protein